MHVHRITNRLKWHRPPTITAEQTRVNLESWLPKDLHKGINPMLVGFGQVSKVLQRCHISPRLDGGFFKSRWIACPSELAQSPFLRHYTAHREDIFLLSMQLPIPASRRIHGCSLTLRQYASPSDLDATSASWEPSVSVRAE